MEKDKNEARALLKEIIGDGIFLNVMTLMLWIIICLLMLTLLVLSFRLMWWSIFDFDMSHTIQVINHTFFKFSAWLGQIGNDLLKWLNNLTAK